VEALLKQLIHLSSSLMERLSGCGIEDIETYKQERDLIFAELQQLNPSPDQAAALRPQVLRIAEMDTVITGRMTELRDEAKREMDKINRETFQVDA